MLLLALVGVAEQDHLTQEGVHDHVLVVDLLAAQGRKAERKEGNKKTKGSKHKKGGISEGNTPERK